MIPTLNRIDLVLRAIASVRCLQSERVEVIVVDDGSDQDLRPLLPRFTPEGILIRTFRFERNRGPQAARNLGIRRAAFSHIAFLDSDDAFSPDKLDRVLAEMDARPFDLLFHGVSGMPRYTRLAHFWVRWSGWLGFHWWIALLNPVVTPALVVRRTARLGPPRMRHCEDWAYLLNFVQPTTQVQFMDAELSQVFRPIGTTGGLSAAIWRMRVGEFRARRVLLRRPTASGLARFVLGSLAGALRIFSDLLRRRYF